MQYTKIEDIIKDLRKLGYKSVSKISGRRVAVITDKNKRFETLNSISEEFKIAGAKFDTSPGAYSSVGIVRLSGDFSIIAKPKNSQGKKSAGLENEMMFLDQILEVLSDNEGSPIHIELKASNTGKILRFKNIVDAKDMGSDTSGRKKADVVLYDNKGTTYPISIKKDSAQYWESADRYWAKNAKKYIDLAVKNRRAILTEQSSGHYVITPVLAIKATEAEKKNVVFGSDILPRGAVITKTFVPSDFSYLGAKNILSIQTHSIINSPSEIRGDKDVYFVIRNDKTRNTNGLYRGIRVLAAYANWLSGKTLIVK